MASPLIARMRKQRECRVQVGKFVFIARRPTDVEALALHHAGDGLSEIARKFVVGWEGVTEDDIVGGGGSDVIAFDPDIWADWCADRPSFWEPIGTCVLEAYQEHAKAVTDAGKN